jgi:hypothetical protein
MLWKNQGVSNLKVEQFNGIDHVAQPENITSIGMRDRAYTGQL